MTLKEIKRAVNDALKKEYPGARIYGNDTIEGYEKPAFFVYVMQTFAESTKNARHKNVEVEIDYIQKRPDEVEGMNFLEKAEEIFGQKLTVGYRSLSTANIDCQFQGENQNIPVVTFDIEFWDNIEKRETTETMKTLIISQEVTQGDYR